MYLEVYIDVIFFINFFMDFILLYSVKKILKWESSFKKTTFGAAVGAIGACILSLVPELNQITQFIISYLIICVIMIWITFKPSSWQVGLKGVIVLYVATFFLGGLFNSLYYHSMLGYYFHELINGRLFQDLNGWKLVFLAIFGIFGTYTLIKIMTNLRNKNKRLYETNLCFGDKKITLTSLLDTGNNLYDPIFNKPVIIIEYSSLMKLLNEKEKHYINGWLINVQNETEDLMNIFSNNTNNIRVFMIPYKSVGKKNGLLPAIKIDKIEIINGNEIICNENVLTGIWKGKFSLKNEYQIILHRDLM